MVRFNTDPLVAPVSDQELRALKRRRAAGEFGKRPFPVLTVVFLAIAVVFVIVLVTFMGSMWAISTQVSGTNSLSMMPWFLVGFVVFFCLVAGLILYSHLRSPGGKTWPLLARFADVNGMRFGLLSPNPQYQGVIFDEGRDRKAVNHLYSPTGVFADAGGYCYTTGSGENRQTHHWNFVAFRLPRRVPHLLLDAKANNKMWGFTNLPEAFHSSQRLTLGAPFDDHYQLYAPGGYGQDAFYLLPPNVMEALLNAPAVYDIEMVDDWLFCYTQSPQDLSDPATWRLFEIITNGLMGTLTPVVSRYRDRHVGPQPAMAVQGVPQGPGQVAPQGTRLRKGFNKAVLVSVAFFVGYVLFRILVQLIFRM